MEHLQNLVARSNSNKISWKSSEPCGCQMEIYAFGDWTKNRDSLCGGYVSFGFLVHFGWRYYMHIEICTHAHTHIYIYTQYLCNLRNYHLYHSILYIYIFFEARENDFGFNDRIPTPLTIGFIRQDLSAWKPNAISKMEVSNLLPKAIFQLGGNALITLLDIIPARFP